MINKHEKVETNEESPILIYPNGVKNRIVFKINKSNTEIIRGWTNN